MRPRINTADDVSKEFKIVLWHHASMRSRHSPQIAVALHVEPGPLSSTSMELQHSLQINVTLVYSPIMLLLE